MKLSEDSNWLILKINEWVIVKGDTSLKLKNNLFSLIMQMKCSSYINIIISKSDWDNF